MNRALFPAAVVLVLTVLSSCGAKISPEAVSLPEDEAFIDLSSRTFEEEGAARLIGNTWEFYWQKLYTPDDFQNGAAVEEPILVKGVTKWNGLIHDGKQLGPDGFATYRTRVLLPREAPYGLYMKNQDSAYRLWIGGELRAENGTLAERAEDYVPKRIPRIFYHHADNAEMEIVIQIANYTHKWGGMTNSLYIGLPQQIQTYVHTIFNTIAFLSGSILIMALYHLFLFINRRKELTALWFSMFCFSVFIWYLFNGAYQLFRLVPSFPLPLGIRLQYFALSGVMPFFLIFFNSAYPEGSERGLLKPVVRILTTVGLFFMLLPVVTPIKFFTAWSLNPFYTFIMVTFAVVLVILFRALRRGSPGSRLALAGFLVITAAAVYDMAADRKLITGSPMGPFSPAGIFIFILLQSFIMANRFSKAYYMLDDLTKNLETKVKLRTAELQREREKVYERDKLAAVGTLAGGIAHEIFNPLSGISGPLSILKKEIAGSSLKKNEMVGRHLGYIEANVEEITSSVNNLKALIKDREILKSTMKLLPVISRAVEQYSMPGGKAVTITIDVGVPDEVLGDPSTVYQIVNNLLSNAVDAVKEGGSILISFKKSGSRRELIVEDDGKGMSSGEAARAAEPFFTTKETEGGTGLGLYLVEKLSETMGWKVEISSHPGKGTRVSLIIS